MALLGHRIAFNESFPHWLAFAQGVQAWGKTSQRGLTGLGRAADVIFDVGVSTHSLNPLKG